MPRRFLYLLACLAIATLWSCDDEDDDQIVNSSSSYILGDLVHFDSCQPIVTALYSEGNYTQSELWVPSDLVVGEPFLDIDDDGAYDPMVDIFWFDVSSTPRLVTFYVSCDSIADTTCVRYHLMVDTTLGYDRVLNLMLANQDLNHNGTYDGPNSDWTPGVPYVDLDGDGEYDRDYPSYQPGLPFADFNENGAFDSELTTEYRIEKYRIESYGPDHLYAHIRLVTANSTDTYPLFRFVSDSGTTYNLNPWYGSVGGLLRFELDSVGFWFVGYSSYPMLLLENGEVHEQSRRAVRTTGIMSELRSISFREKLTVGGDEYSGLAVVDITRMFETADTTQGLHLEARFYFSPNELHLLAARFATPGEDSVWIYLNRRPDALPLPMIR